MTLISLYNSEGCIGRCDAKCYNAKDPHCNCICGGKNHGAGKHKALQNCQNYLIEELKKIGQIELANQLKQPELF